MIIFVAVFVGLGRYDDSVVEDVLLPASCLPVAPVISGRVAWLRSRRTCSEAGLVSFFVFPRGRDASLYGLLAAVLHPLVYDGRERLMISHHALSVSTLAGTYKLGVSQVLDISASTVVVGRRSFRVFMNVATRSVTTVPRNRS